MMRVLFTVYPHPAHLHPLVSYAWALQSAGHDICVAAPPGTPNPEFDRVVTAAGLTAVRCGEPHSIPAMGANQATFVPTIEEANRYIKALAIEPDDYNIWDCFYHFMLYVIRNNIPPEPRHDVDAVIEFARVWQPDLVIWDSWYPCGAVAARACGAAHARVPTSPDYIGWVTDRFAQRQREVGPGLLENPLAETVRRLAERHDVEMGDDLLVGQWTINPFPAAMTLARNILNIPVRNTPYTGAGVRPDWLHARQERPRVALSLGVSTREFYPGDWGRTAKIMDAVADLDIEVIATLNKNQLLDVPNGVPDNVHVSDYIPLGQLLPTCSALIHHGAPGTTAAGNSMSVPQLICDTDERARFIGERRADSIEWSMLCQKQITAPIMARYVVDRGAGMRIDHQTQSAEEIRASILRVLNEPSFQEGARTIHEEYLATPSPAEIVPVLERLTERFASRSAPVRC